MKFNIMLFFLSIFSIFLSHASEKEKIKIAFMPDVHFQDLKGNLLSGLTEPTENTVRTMSDQLISTRLFNENYFAFRAALDDAVKNDSKLIVLNGDFSDDGQPYNLLGLKRILDEYHHTHGVQFFLSPGNHDPTSPFGRPSSMKRLLTPSGESIELISPERGKCKNLSEKVVCSEQAREAGYKELVEILGSYGFTPQPSYLHWETPFSSIKDNYSFDRMTNSDELLLSNRSFEICSIDGEACAKVPDLSYLVEPVEGVWLLSIDANVFVPYYENGELRFQGASNAGFNYVIEHKNKLIDWIVSVTKRAKLEGKKLITFSHYPMTGFYDGADSEMHSLFGDKAHQLERSPLKSTSEKLTQLGIRLHIGGHMHINDSMKYQSENEWLINVQVPSLAAYIPAYKTATVNMQSDDISFELNKVTEVSNFKALFPLYRKEAEKASKYNPELVWPIEILESKSYLEFTKFHIRELSFNRFLNEWPNDLRELLFLHSAQEILQLIGVDSIDDPMVDFSGRDLIVDYYKVRNAGYLAIEDIGLKQIDRYKHFYALASRLKKSHTNTQYKHLMLFLDIFNKIVEGDFCDRFTVNLTSGEFLKHCETIMY
ncbi:metallophosphoesterase [Alteromonas macleodii]|uniref:metallophosphoesterase n=1 Tax=Alteromonas macleodii TaxID=28108 RepID=UPI0006921BA3|nr:metallophosphoesterase [Alteromonas macleodii]